MWMSQTVLLAMVARRLFPLLIKARKMAKVTETNEPDLAAVDSSEDSSEAERVEEVISEMEGEASASYSSDGVAAAPAASVAAPFDIPISISPELAGTVWDAVAATASQFAPDQYKEYLILTSSEVTTLGTVWSPVFSELMATLGQSNPTLITALAATGIVVGGKYVAISRKVAAGEPATINAD
jgi:hypothetical protein